MTPLDRIQAVREYARLMAAGGVSEAVREHGRNILTFLAGKVPNGCR